MAEAKLFKCTKCEYTIKTWSDGNPYYISHSGSKKYAYHPDHENLARCIGNDEPYLCLECAAEFVNDSQKHNNECPQCHSKNIANSFNLENKQCPFCQSGKFISDPNFECMS